MTSARSASATSGAARLIGITERLFANGTLLTTLVALATVACHVLYLVPATRDLTIAALDENNVVEWLTVITLFAAAVVAGFLAWRQRRARSSTLVWGFLALFALGVFVVAMEEISWGQWLFSWDTPDSIREVNRQGETNLHNLGGLWGNSEWFRLVFAVGALVGVVVNRWPRWRAVATPPSLTGLFAIATFYVLADLVDDLVDDAPWFFSSFTEMSEWIELLIGVGALGYAVLKRRELASPVGQGVGSP